MYDHVLIRRLNDALLDAYNRETLERMLLFQLGKRLDHIVEDGDFLETVYQLIEQAKREGWLNELAQSAHASNQGNVLLAEISAEFRKATENATGDEPTPDNPDKPQPAPIEPVTEAPSPLTNLVQKHGRTLLAALGGLVLAMVAFLIFFNPQQGGNNSVTPTTTSGVAESDSETPAPEAQLVTAGDVGGGGSLIAYQAELGSASWHIFTVDLDGKNRQQLTDGDSNNVRPKWSPNGEQIAFRTDRNGNEDIWVMDADGANARPLVEGSRDEHAGAWSPDSQQMAYHADAGNNVVSIYSLTIDSDVTTRLTSSGDGSNFWPSWSPDGSRVVFWSLRNGSAEVFVMDADGSNQEVLVSGNGTYLDPVWSPISAETIAYYEAGQSGVFTVSAETGRSNRIDTGIPGSNILSGWSPDGEWLLLHTDLNGSDDLYRVRADGSQRIRLTTASSADQFPVWQPDNSGGRIDKVIDENVQGELIVWTTFSDGDANVLSGGFTELATKYPDLSVTVTDLVQDENGLDSLKWRYMQAAEDGELPDIFLAPSDWGGEFIELGIVAEPLFLMPKADVDRIDSSALANLQHDGQLVGMPYATRGTVMLRNRELVSNAPTSVDGIFALDDDTYDLEIGLYYSGATLAAQGGQLMDADGQPSFDTPGGVSWLEALTQFGDDQSYGNNDADGFGNGDIGLVMEGTWNIANMANQLGREKIKIDAWPAGLSGWVLYDVAYVSAELTPEKRDAATVFLSHLVSRRVQTGLADVNHIPVTSDATIGNRLTREAQRVLRTSEPFPVAPEMAQYWEQLTVAINTVVLEGDDPASALEDAATVIRARLK